VGLEPLSCEDRLRDGGWFSQKEGCLQGHPTAFPALIAGMEDTQQSSSQGAWQEAERQWHKLKHEKLRLGDQEMPFPHEGSAAVGCGPRRLGCLLHCRVSRPGSVKPEQPSLSP